MAFWKSYSGPVSDEYDVKQTKHAAIFFKIFTGLNEFIKFVTCNENQEHELSNGQWNCGYYYVRLVFFELS
jgi:hypothetical protein